MKTGVIIAIVAVVVIVIAAAAVVMMNNNSTPSGDTEYTVTITIDNGTVDSSSVKVKSGTTWSTSANVLTFSDGKKVTATPNSGYKFSSWSPTSGTVKSNTTIKATCATEKSYTVTISASNGGKVDKTTVSVVAGTTWSTSANVLTFSDGQKVTATADKDYTFSAWTPASGTVNSATIISASFTKSSTSYTVTISAGTGGSISKTSLTVPGGTTWSSAGTTLSFSDGQSVTATAASGYSFAGWSPASGTVSSATTIGAQFTKASVSYTITISAGTGGSVSKSSLQVVDGIKWTSSGSTLSFGDGQTVTATPDSGYTFSAWSPASGTVSSDATITASFNGSTSKEVSFYFTDNFENDGFKPAGDAYPSDPYAIIPGVWVKGKGADMESAFKDACNTFGISATVTSGKITEMNGVADGNLYIWAWDGSKWFDKVQKNSLMTYLGASDYLTLSDLSISDYSYVAVVHGANAANGDAPAVKTTPNDIKWYYGDNIAPGSGKQVTFYISNNFGYTHFASDRTDASDYQHLIVQGLWVRGYANNGSPVMDAFKNALDRIGFSYDISSTGFTNFINDCGGGNFLQSIWDNDARDWYKDTNTHWFIPDFVDDVDYAGMTYGAWGDGYVNPPWPLSKPPCDWAY